MMLGTSPGKRGKEVALSRKRNNISIHKIYNLAQFFDSFYLLYFLGQINFMNIEILYERKRTRLCYGPLVSSYLLLFINYDIVAHQSLESLRSFPFIFHS